MGARDSIRTALLLLSIIAFSQSLNPPMISSLDEAEFGAPGSAIIAQELDWTLVESVPKDSLSFTQGLEIHDGLLYESGGLYGQSSLRIFPLGSGTPLESVNLSSDLFGEGLTIYGDEIIVLTWKSGRVLRYSLGLELVNESVISGEGWGICSMNNQLATSDGSSRITFRNPADLVQVSNIDVTLNGEPLDQINELECLGDKIYANRWYDNRIFEIDMQTGVVTSVIDFSSLIDDHGSEMNGHVLNGIAFDSLSGDFWITGKNWTDFHRISIIDDNQNVSSFNGRFLIVFLVSSSLFFPLFGSVFFNIREPKGIQAAPHVGRHGGAPHG